MSLFRLRLDRLERIILRLALTQFLRRSWADAARLLDQQAHMTLQAVAEVLSLNLVTEDATTELVLTQEQFRVLARIVSFLEQLWNTYSLDPEAQPGVTHGQVQCAWSDLWDRLIIISGQAVGGYVSRLALERTPMEEVA